MKRILPLCLAFLTFCGCTRYTDYVEPENRLFVSAIGIDSIDGKLKLYIEATETNDLSEGYTVTHLESTGKNFKECIINITSGVAKQFNLSHCAVVLISENIKNGIIEEFTNYFFNSTDITLSVYFACCSYVKPFFSLKKPFGYSMASLIKNNRNGAGIKPKCSLISIENSKDVFILPFFKAEGNKINLIGTKVYVNYIPVSALSIAESKIFGLLQGTYKSGELLINSSTVNIKNAAVKKSGSVISLTLNCTCPLPVTTFKKAIKKDANHILNLFYGIYKKDVFLLNTKNKPNLKITVITE